MSTFSIFGQSIQLMEIRSATSICYSFSTKKADSIAIDSFLFSGISGKITVDESLKVTLMDAWGCHCLIALVSDRNTIMLSPLTEKSLVV